MIGEQLGLALSRLSNMKGVEDEPVHEARKAIKKSRSLMRLMRKTLGSEFDARNDELRQAGRRLSELRDAQALIETVDELSEKSEQQADHNSLARLRKLLCTRKEQIAGKMSGGNEVSTVIQALEKVRGRIGLWPIADVTHGEFNDAVMTSVRRGRKAFQIAQDSQTDDRFHDWRKRAKDLRYQLEILDKSWPGVLDGYAGCAEELEQALGEDHNLAVLKVLSTRELGKQLSASHAKRLQPLIKQRQEKLRKDAGEIGGRLYGEKLTSWSDRLDLCWNGSNPASASIKLAQTRTTSKQRTHSRNANQRQARDVRKLQCDIRHEAFICPYPSNTCCSACF
jgi:CHAD domain-containing protein